MNEYLTNLYLSLTDEDKAILENPSRLKMFVDSANEDRKLMILMLAFPLTPEDGIGAVFYCYSNWREFVKE